MKYTSLKFKSMRLQIDCFCCKRQKGFGNWTPFRFTQVYSTGMQPPSAACPAVGLHERRTVPTHASIHSPTHMLHFMLPPLPSTSKAKLCRSTEPQHLPGFMVRFNLVPKLLILSSRLPTLYSSSLATNLSFSELWKHTFQYGYP